MRIPTWLPILLAAAACDPDDPDGDGFGEDEDCDPQVGSAYPGAEERCNGIDDDCDGFVDEPSTLGEFGGAVDTFAWHPDRDQDGFGDPDFVTKSCEPPAPTGWTPPEDATDCDDDDPTIYPGAQDPAGGVDQDCDGAP